MYFVVDASTKNIFKNAEVSVTKRNRYGTCGCRQRFNNLIRYSFQNYLSLLIHNKECFLQNTAVIMA